MCPRLLLVALASLIPIASRAEAPDDPPANAASIMEEVVVTARGPRYVAPTLRDRIGRIWAPVYINGRGPFRLVLDTGANRTAVVPKLASRLGIPIETHPVRLLGTTGTSLVPVIKVASIEVGDLWLTDRDVAVVPDVFGGAEGVLGADGLADKRILIDFMNGRISIQRSVGAVPSLGHTLVPVKIRDGHLLTFDLRVAGVDVTALLDTGAQATIGNSRLREALIKRAARGTKERIVGVTLDAQDGETFRAPRVDIAGIGISNMRVTFGDIYIFDAWKINDVPALLIGMDIIGLLDSLIIDYPRQELHLRPRSGPGGDGRMISSST